MGYGVAMPKQCYAHLSAEDRDSGPDARPCAPNDGEGIGPQPYARPPLSRLYGAGPGGRQSRSAPATPHTPGSLAVAPGAGPVGGGSPEQIAGCLRRAYPDDLRIQLSVATIYMGLSLWMAPEHPAR
jgi:hypothetical protein